MNPHFSIIGFWQLESTEIPNYSLIFECVSFAESGKYSWFRNQGCGLIFDSFDYSLDEFKIFISKNERRINEISYELNECELVLVPSHGMKSKFKKLCDHDPLVVSLMGRTESV
jgi:hypothetical protein